MRYLKLDALRMRLGHDAPALMWLPRYEKRTRLVATPTEIYLAGQGKSISGEPIFRADKVDGLDVKWMGAAHVTIYADAARIFRKQDSKELSLNTGKATVTIDLKIVREIQ